MGADRDVIRADSKAAGQRATDFEREQRRIEKNPEKVQADRNRDAKGRLQK